MIGCLPTQALAFLAVFVRNSQAIAFEWKPGLTYQLFHVGSTFVSAQIVVVLNSYVLLILCQARSTLADGASQVHAGSSVFIVFQVNR